MSQPALPRARAASVPRRRSFSKIWHPLGAPALIIALTLVLITLGSRLTVPRLQFQAGDPDDQIFLFNFYSVEQNDTDVYRWSQPQAALLLYGFEGTPAIVEMRLASPRPDGAEAAMLTLRTQGQKLASFSLTSDWRKYRVLVPTNPSGDTVLMLDSPPFQPERGDLRQLGFAISSVDAQPAHTASAFAVLTRIVFLVSLPLLAWLLLRWFGANPSIAWSGGIVMAGIAGWAAANPVISGYLLPTVWWPWWPLLILLLAVASPTLRWLSGRALFAPWSGLLLAFAALVWLRQGLDVAIGLLLLLAGNLIALAGLSQIWRRSTVAASLPYDKPLPLRLEAGSLLIITALALGLRFYHLDTLPLGLWRDESRHGLLAMRIWNDPSFRPVYIVGGADLPALLFYLMAPIVGLFGPHPWSARLVSALIGGLTPLALWWAARPMLGSRAALCGAALIAWASWSLSMSRWGFPATLDQFLVLAAIGFMWRALTNVRDEDSSVKTGKSGFFRSSRFQAHVLMGMAALCAGLATYAYHTGRMAPLILVIVTAIRLGWSRRAWRQAFPALVVAGLVGLLTVAPLLLYIANDYQGYNRRVAMVSVFNTAGPDIHTPLGLLMRNLDRYLLMWHVSGEWNGRHHAPGAPMLGPFAGILLFIGLGVALIRRWQPAALALLAWLLVSLVPGLLSGNPPHAMRSFGALAPACILAGWGIVTILRHQQMTYASAYQEQGESHRQGARKLLHAVRARWSFIVLVIFLVGSFIFNTRLYFGQMARDPGVYSNFDIVETAMSRVARTPSITNDPDLQKVQVYLPERSLENDTIRYLTSGINVQTFNGANLSSPPGSQALVLLPPDSPPEDHESVRQALGPTARSLDAPPVLPDGAGPIFYAYGIGEAAERLLVRSFE
ncbi:MAG: glycosyltransferase family 39 protein [Chloroflexales bacterium]|nr:glycosyltransferase family 39 protein [Chloroflexales bacterium]